MTSPPPPALRWDIFCKVIDNHGDLGVCWRLARQLAAQGCTVRLWVDDANALAWMAPQGGANIEVRMWGEALQAGDLAPAHVLVEAFGCEIPPTHLQRYMSWRAADGQPAAWINLEYLSAESYVERSHGLPSPIMHGPARGLNKHFFYPGFTPRTGGLLREPDVLQRQAAFDRRAWLTKHGIAPDAGGPVVSLFCYEPENLQALLEQLALLSATLLVTPGRAAAAVRACAIPAGLRLHDLPYLTQDNYDHLLWSCDLNFVRGEDSLVRALWAGQPLVWHIYPQHDDAHHAKLQAWLDWMQAPNSLRAFHQTWNGLNSRPLPALDLPAWAACTAQARRRLLEQADLSHQLLEFVARIRA